MDVSELHDEENLLVQMQDRWENYGSLDGIADTHDPFDLAGAPRFELAEKIDNLLNHALTEDENLLLRQTLGMGCKQRSVKILPNKWEPPRKPCNSNSWKSSRNYAITTIQYNFGNI